MTIFKKIIKSLILLFLANFISCEMIDSPDILINTKNRTNLMNNNNGTFVEFVTPKEDITINKGEDLYVKVYAYDIDGLIDDVRLYVDGQFVRREQIPPYEWNHKNQDELLKNMQPGTYEIMVIATDNDENIAVDSIKVTVQCNQSQTLELSPVADSFIKNTKPDKNLGKETKLHVDNHKVYMETFLRFSIPDLTEKVKSAKLRIHVTNGSGKGPELYLTSNDWNETEITFNNKPCKQGPKIADFKYIPIGWREIDVTSAISQQGDISFIIVPISQNGIAFSSRECENKPVLIIETGE